MDQRSAFKSSETLLSAGRVELAVNLGDLLWRKAAIRKLRIEDFNLRDDNPEDGDSLLDLLFSHPDDFEYEEVETSENTLRKLQGQLKAWEPPVPVDLLAPAGEQAEKGDEPGGKQLEPGDSNPGDSDAKPKLKKKRRVKRKKEHKPFKASDLKLAFEAEEASVENAHIDLVDRRQKTHLVFDRVRIALKGLDVAPDDLAHHNVCNLELGGSIRLEKTDVSQVLVDCSLKGTGMIKPFDPESGEWFPDYAVELTLGKGSLLGGTLMKDQMRGKDADKLAEYGIDLGDLALGGVLGQDASTDVHVAKGKLIVKKDTRLVFPQYEIALSGGSWFNGGTDSHIARGELVVSPEVSAGILEQSQKKLAVKYGDTIAALAAQAVVAVLEDDQKRMVIKFKSRGSLSKPEIAWDNPLNDIKDLLKDAGASLLNGLLNK